MRDEAEVVTGALIGWLQARYGGPVTSVEPSAATTGGFDSVIHLVQFAGEALPAEWQAPLVLRIKPDPDRHDEAVREAAVQAWLADRAYPAPRVLRVLAPGELLDRPVQVMARAPGSLLVDDLRRAPWRTGRAAHQLASLHVQLHRLPTTGFPADEDLLDRRLHLPRQVAATLDDPALRAGLARVESLADDLRDAPPVVCHGDFHPLNILVSGPDAAVVDWTDAGLGDRHGDVARTLVLFDLAVVAAPSPAERLALRTVGRLLARGYRRAYEQHLPLDPRRLALWEPVHLLHGWSQAAARHAGLLGTSGVGNARANRLRPQLLDELRARFHDGLAHVTGAT